MCLDKSPRSKQDLLHMWQGIQIFRCTILICLCRLLESPKYIFYIACTQRVLGQCGLVENVLTCSFWRRMFYHRPFILWQFLHAFLVCACHMQVFYKRLCHTTCIWYFLLFFFVNSFSVVLMKAWSIKYKFTQRTLCREPFVMLNFKVLLKTNYIVKTLGTILAFKFFCRLVPDIKFLQHLPLLSI